MIPPRKDDISPSIFLKLFLYYELFVARFWRSFHGICYSLPILESAVGVRTALRAKNLLH